jgi:hypothetical protein
MGKIIPATEDRPASIELAPEEQEKVEQATPETFLDGSDLFRALRLRVTEDEVLTEEAREALEKGVVEVEGFSAGGETRS